jgi:hypothetical protein
LEKEYEGRIRFVRVNVLDRKNAALLDRFGFSTTPELYLLDEQGQTIGFWSDVVAPQELRQAFDRALTAAQTR